MFKETPTESIWELHKVPTPNENGGTVTTYAHYGDTVEIIFTLGVRGEATVNGKKFAIDGKNVLYIAPKQLHSVTYLSGGEFIRVLHIDLKKLSAFVDVRGILHADGKYLSSVPVNCHDFEPLYKNAVMAADTELSISERISVTLEIFRLLTSKTEDGLAALPHKGNAARLMEWVEKNYASKISISDAAEAFGYNKNYFSKWVRESVGTNFSDFVNSVRISHACVCLSEGRTIENTAELCGYGDPSYFIKVFKKLRGTTPKSYASQKRDHAGY